MSPCEPGPRLLGNLYIIILGTLTTLTWKTWEPCREPWRNFEGTFWEPFGNLEGTLRNLGNLGNLEGTLGTLGTFTWEPGNLYLGTWEPLLGNLYLGTWEPLLGNLGTFTWEPANLYLGTFTWNLGTLGEWVLELLRSAPKPLIYYGWRPQSILLLGNNVFTCLFDHLLRVASKTEGHWTSPLDSWPGYQVLARSLVPGHPSPASTPKSAVAPPGAKAPSERAKWQWFDTSNTHISRVDRHIYIYILDIDMKWYGYIFRYRYG